MPKVVYFAMDGGCFFCYNVYGDEQMIDYRTEAPAPVRDFLVYHETIKGQSKATIDSYYLDLRTFSRFMALTRGLVPRDTDLADIDIRKLDLAFYESVTLQDIYDFLAYLSRDRELNASSRARMVISIKGFYSYHTDKIQNFKTNPVKNLDTPKQARTLPHYLSLEESKKLLASVGGKNPERDYCIICLFLNCGLRISELVGLNLADIKEDHLNVHGKGNKERVVYLNTATIEAINNWLVARNEMGPRDEKALFLSQRRTRISVDSVQTVVRNTLKRAGLDTALYSPHKLRHTAATLMLQNGVDVRTLQDVLGHENLNTTQIYTHVANSQLQNAATANPLAEYSPASH